MSTPAREEARLILRRLETAADMAPCVELQRRAWNYAERDLVPVNELVAAIKAGGIAIGAFEQSAAGSRNAAPTMIGFCFGLLGRDPTTGELYHASRMLAVDPAHRRRGVAVALKQAQRRAALAQGLDHMRWTFDPLRLENAWLNLHKLGAVGIAYHRNLFGPSTSSPLHQGGTDRLEVQWRLNGSRPAYTIVKRVELPTDVEALARRDPTRLNEVRETLRREFESALERKEVVAGVERSSNGDRAWYLIGRPTSAPSRPPGNNSTDEFRSANTNGRPQ